MRNLARVAAVLSAAVATLFLFGTPAYAQGTLFGCPSGYVCIYTGTTFDANQIQWKQNQAGGWAIHGFEGNHIIFNNQTDGWIARPCTSWNGTSGCVLTLDPSYYVIMDMHPINSIRISP